MAYNIHHGEGMDGRLDVERIADVINLARPDFVALQEVDRGVARTDGRDLAVELAKLTGMQMAFGRNIDYQGGEYGNAILSRHPILSSTNLHYRMLREGEQRGLLQAIINADGRELVVLSTHLDYRPDPAERLSNVAEIKRVAAAHGARPVIVAGDFNAPPGSPTHVAMKEAFIDSWEVGGVGDGFTIPSPDPTARIDYVFLNSAVPWRVIGARVPATTASDHLPVVVEVMTGR